MAIAGGLECYGNSPTWWEAQLRRQEGQEVLHLACVSSCFLQSMRLLHAESRFSCRWPGFSMPMCVLAGGALQIVLDSITHSGSILSMALCNVLWDSTDDVYLDKLVRHLLSEAVPLPRSHGWTFKIRQNCLQHIQRIVLAYDLAPEEVHKKAAISAALTTESQVQGALPSRLRPWLRLRHRGGLAQGCSPNPHAGFGLS